VETDTNKYRKWYDKIIQRARNRKLEGYVEKHHIIPRSLGGGDEKCNIVHLTGREHYICHLLLLKITEGKDREKMISAWWFLAGKRKKDGHVVNSRIYSHYKTQRSELQKGKTHIERFGQVKANAMKIANMQSKLGKKQSLSTRIKKSIALTGRKRSDLEKKAISRGLIGKPSHWKGKKRGKQSPEHLAKLSSIRKGRIPWNKGLKLVNLTD